MEIQIKKNHDIGVIVGRFQVAKLHAGHKSLIEKVISSHKRTLILLGVATTLGTKNNPLDFTSRLGLFDEYYEKYPGKFIIQPILDTPGNNITWSQNLDRIIRTNFPLGTVCLYGGRDSFIKSYHGIFDTHEIEIISNEEGTNHRKEVGKEVLRSEDFRAGQIYQSQNQYPKVFPTVDIAVVKTMQNKKFVLMGMKKDSSAWAFPGGFVDPTDLTLEQAAIRELHEEIDIEIPTDLRYISSHRIDDSRYTGEERIITTFFYTEHQFGVVRPKEEFIRLEWIKISKDQIDGIAEQHHILFRSLINFMKKEKTNG